MRNKVIAVAAAVVLVVLALTVDIYGSWQYGELTVGLRQAPNVCADLILRGPASNGASFYAGTECDY